MSQIKIKQIDQLEQSLNAITGVTTVVESYATNQATGNTGIQNTFEAKEVSGVKVHVNGLQIEDFSWLNVTTDYVPAGSNLVFDSVAAGFELQSTDIIKLTYEYLANGSSTYTGSGSGSTGAQGAVGPQGPKGDSGVVSSGQFKWSNWMGQAPGFQAGNMEYGGVSTYGEATQLTFHKEDADGVDQSTFLDQYLNAKSGQIKTILDANSGHHNVFQIVGASIDSNGNYSFDVYNVSQDEIAVTTGSTTVYFVLVGAEGSAGADGADGAQGPQGADGAQGAQGATGAAGSGGSGNISGTVDGSLIPDSNDSYDLGSAEYKFRDLYLGDNTLHMGDKSLSRTNIDDSMEIKNISIPSSQTSEGNRGDVVFDDTYMYICISTNSWKRINLDTSW